MDHQRIFTFRTHGGVCAEEQWIYDHDEPIARLEHKVIEQPETTDGKPEWSSLCFLLTGSTTFAIITDIEQPLSPTRRNRSCPRQFRLKLKKRSVCAA